MYVSKILSPTNANIFCISVHIYLKKRIYIDILTLDSTHSFEYNNAIASCNIRYQIANDFINGLDISADARPVEIYVASWLNAQIILNHFK